MSLDIESVISIAKSEIGYLEKETYSQLDDPFANAGDSNYTKYQRDLAAIKYFNSSKKGTAWCAVFVAWCYVTAYGADAAHAQLCQPYKDNCGAGCNSAMNYFKRKGQLYSSPEPGDVIFFWNSAKKEASHVGIVEKVDSSYVYTIEGNTSNKSGVVANGGAVASKKYNLANSRIAGYGRPDYASAMPNSDYKIQNNEEVFPMTEGKAWVTVEKGSTVNFRQKASTSSAKVVGMPTIKKGEEVTVISGDQTWAAVEYKGYHGYIMQRYLTQDCSLNDNSEDSVKTVDQLFDEITCLLSQLADMAR